MSTASFGKAIIVKSDKAADVLIRGAETRHPAKGKSSAQQVVTKEILAKKAGSH